MADSSLALVNARLVDGVSDTARDGMTVIVEGERIVRVEPTRAVTLLPETAVIDADGRTVMPGLVDAHLHISSLALSQPELRARDLPVELRAFALTAVAKNLLDGGITALRDCGQYGTSLFSLRRAVELGLLRAPRLVLSGQIVAATSPGAHDFPGMYREANGPDEMRTAVREQVRAGADFIKTMVTGALTVPGEDVEPAQLTPDELAAIVSEAHRLGRHVAAHAEGLEGIQLAVGAGVDTIEHGELAHLDPTILDEMARQEIVLVPTLTLFNKAGWNDPAIPGWMRDRAARLAEAAQKTIDLARQAGVQIAMGADSGPYGDSAQELVWLVNAGLSTAEALRAGTSISARASGLGARVGRVQVGYEADLLVVDGDPLADISILTRKDALTHVILRGEVVAGSALR